LTASGLDFRVLGPLEIVRGGERATIGGPKQRALLALLLTKPNEVFPPDLLLDHVWADDQPGGGRRTLRVHLSNLRKVLEPERRPGDPSGVIVTEQGGYALRVDPGQIDATRFEHAVAEGRRLRISDPEQAASVLSDALDEWRGRPYEDLAYESFLQNEIRRLEELRLMALEDRLDAELAGGRHTEAVVELQTLTDEYPFRERLWELLMLALYRSGRQADALRAYQEARRRLGEELGIEPTPALRRLEGEILFHDPSLAFEGDSGAPRHNLPARTSSFLGREDEMRAVAERLAEARQVTLTGPGGVGKTSLAIEASRSFADEFRDGVWLVDLAPVGDPGFVVQAVAEALGIPDLPADDRVAAVARRLGDRQLLLLLDNCEHVIDDSAALSASILRAAPGVVVVATSRQPLRIPGETVIDIPPLAIPPRSVGSAEEAEAYESVRLFAARAAATRGGFALDDTAAPAVVEICRRLDGIPLAIELAAAQTAFLSARQLAARLGDRLADLGGEERTRAPRHQTLWDMIAWSYELLDPAEQALFARLSVLEGEFSLEAAEAVGGDAGGVDTLGRLVDRSMVVALRRGGVAGDTRFRLLETLRSFARERLESGGEAEEIRFRHLAYYRRLVERAEPVLDAKAVLEWADRLELEYPNIRAALEWSRGHEDGAETARFAGGLRWLWGMRLRNAEGWYWLQAMLAATEGSPAAARMPVLTAAAATSWGVGDYPRAQKICDEAIQATTEVGNRHLLADALWSRGRVALSQGDGSAGTYFERSLVVATELEDRWRMARAVMIAPLDASEAREALENCIEVFRDENDGFLEAVSMSMLGRAVLADGDLEEARRITTDALNQLIVLGMRKELPYTLYQLCEIHRLRSDLVQAAAFGARALEVASEFDVALLVTKALMHIGAVAIDAGLRSDGARLL
jgi:predicted ATPase/DNA-binding SARP family transcriptional activator